MHSCIVDLDPVMPLSILRVHNNNRLLLFALRYPQLHILCSRILYLKMISTFIASI